MIGRALLVVMLVLTFNHAGAQIGSMPWMPSSPQAWPPAGQPVWPLGSSLASPLPQCQALLALHHKLQGQGEAIAVANQKKASLQIGCKLFRDYVLTAATFLEALKTNGRSCGVPPETAERTRNNHAGAQQIAARVCAAITPPSLLDEPRQPIEDPTWRLHPRPTIDGPRPFRMSPQRGL